MTRMQKYKELRERLEKESREYQREQSKKLFNEMFGDPLKQIDEMMDLPRVYFIGGGKSFD